ncbi:MAG: hypothetical protein PHY59_01250 [Methanobacterium sp.]|nr:hypothetical protein [Methanobacterium sp.]
MDNKIIIVGIIILITFLSGCIQSDISKIDGLSSSINFHLKNGDVYLNNATYDTNKAIYNYALTNCENATSEFKKARKFAFEGFTYAQNSNNTIYINYMQSVLDEIDAKLNATNELKTAIPLLINNNTIDANNHIGNANGFIEKATGFYSQRNAIIRQNPDKFKIINN